jgi:hypothetical protein
MSGIMRGRTARRVSALLHALVLAFAVLLARPLHPCERQGDRRAGRHAAPAHAGHHAHHPQPARDDTSSPGPCTCLDGCQAAPAFVPSLPVAVAAVHAIVLSHVAFAPVPAPRRAAPHLLPFSIGPPPRPA